MCADNWKGHGPNKTAVIWKETWIKQWSRQLKKNMTTGRQLSIERRHVCHVGADKWNDVGPKDGCQLKGYMTKTMQQTIEKEHCYIKSAVNWKETCLPYGSRQFKKYMTPKSLLSIKRKHDYHNGAENWRGTWLHQDSCQLKGAEIWKWHGSKKPVDNWK